MAGPRRRLRQVLGVVGLSVVASGLVGCQISYYGHLLKGQTAVLMAREPIAEIVDAPDTPPELRRQLALVAAARDFASTQLGLPDSGSYTSFVALDRDYVLWNVFAAPAFSLVPHQWCHAFVGCLNYRGYYRSALAEAEAQRLRARGLDVHIGGVPAYSTLGWFDDPLLSSMLGSDDAALIATVFHELAHERLFIGGDTAFDESFASFVAEEGLRQWAQARGEPLPRSALARQRQQAFLALLMETRARLEQLYASECEADTLRSRKASIIRQLHADYVQLRDRQWQGWAGYDGWFDSPVNNARLVPIGLYNQWIPAFEVLFREHGGQWPAFYAAVEALGALPPEQRQQQLQALAARAASP